MLGMRPCHSERSEESRTSDCLSAQVYPRGILRVSVLPASLDCQDVYVVFAQRLGILRRFTPQNDKRRAPSVILNAVKNPEPSDCLSAQVYPRGILRVFVLPASLDCQDVYVVFAQRLGILRRCAPRNDSRRAPSVILNAVKNPEPSDRSSAHVYPTMDSQGRRTTCAP